MKQKIINLKIREILLSILCILFCSFSVYARQMDEKPVSGTITDEKNEPIIGATIREKGLTNGTVTDMDGKFNIYVQSGAILQFSYVGYVTQEVTVGEQSELQIKLKENSQQLGEVVVTALGITRNTRTLSYATQSIKGDELNEIRNSSGNLTSMLAGKIAGAVVTTASTGPGGAASIVLRGNKSFSGVNSALFVVDGVIYGTGGGGDASTNKTYGSSDIGANINPDDIVSINVLKGPTAAALYGSSAANGAIIITTKQGAEGKMSIDYNGGVSFEQPMLLMDLQNTYGRGSTGQYSANAGMSWGAPANCYPDNVCDFFETAPSFNNFISVSGGNKIVKGYVSYTNNIIYGITPENRMDRNTVNLRVNTGIIKGLTTDTKITYVNKEITGRPPLGDAGTPNSAYIMPRDMSNDELKQYEIIDPVTQQPVRQYWYNSSIYDNPYWIAYRNPRIEQGNQWLLLASVKYEFTDWLSLQGRINYDKINSHNDFKFYDGTKSSGGEVGTGGRWTVGLSDNTTRQMDILLSGHNNTGTRIEVVYNLGASTRYNKFVNAGTGASSFVIPNKFHMNYAAAQGGSSSTGETMLNSVYGSAQIGFDHAVYLDLTARNDWSSTLPSPYTYFYPSAGLSAVLSDLIRMPKWIGFAKARASYTQVGNGAPQYSLRDTYSFYATTFGKGVMWRSDAKKLPDLKPEQTKSYEVGLDARFFGNRIGIDFAWYHSNSYNFLLLAAMPTASGYLSRLINAGNIENKGVELMLNLRPVVTTDFEWSSTLNYSKNTNKIIEISPYQQRLNIYSGNYGTIAMREGESHGELFGYVWKKDAATGKYIVNSMGLPLMEADQKVGNYHPDWQLGWNNTFTYKNFRLSFQIDGRFGGEIISGTDSYLASFGLGSYTEKYRDGGWILDAVYEDGRPNRTAITAEQFWTTVSQSRNAWAEFFTFDATNVRLRELSLACDFKLKKEHFFKNAQISLTGRNLLIFYRGKSILDIPGLGKRTIPVDPESAMGAGSFQGVEVGMLPAARAFGVNVKLSFR
jgi:TonB-linked SusC/RagA family outer membrane protein